MKVKGAILIINCGSSSLKYEIINFPDKRSIGKGIIEKIGESAGIFTHKALETHKIFEDTEAVVDHSDAFKKVSRIIVDKEFGVISSPKDIIAVGHRVVHGGELYSQSVIIDDTVADNIKDLSKLAPLHNPANHTGIKSAQKIFLHCPHIAVFDTAFHQTMPARAYMYPLPYLHYSELNIRRYGAHGTSHLYISDRSAELLGKNKNEINIISCHLGNGSSIAAIRKGKSVDTSMGFTPLAGVMMGTRCGDIDPAIITYLMKQGRTPDEIDVILNKRSGLLGISGISNDMRDIESYADKDNRAILSLEMYAHNIRKFIGAYVAELGKVDLLVFTAGIGEHGKKMRERICNTLQGLGIRIDSKKNEDYKKHGGIISTNSSPVKIAVIPTNEELQIALDAYKLITE